jgi:HlyD family secretion protein
MRHATVRRGARVTLPVVLALNVITGLLTGGVVYYLVTNKKPAQGGTEAQGRLPRPLPNQVAALGRLEPADGVIDIPGPPGDVIREVRVKEGDTVEPNTRLVVLEGEIAREKDLELQQKQFEDAVKKYNAAVESAKALVEVARARVAQAEAGGQAEAPAQAEKIRLLRDQVANANEYLEKLRRLQGSGRATVSAQDLAAQELKAKQLEGELRVSEAGKGSADLVQKKNLQIARAQEEAAAADLERVKADNPKVTLEPKLKLARETLERTQIRSPIRGKALKVFAKVGEAVGPRPLVQVADVDNMVVVAEVYETDVDRLRHAGEVPVKAVSAALPKPYYDPANPDQSRGLTGRVTQIGTQVAKNRIFDVDPTAAVDRRVIEVRAKLDDESAKVAAEFLNLQVNVFFSLPGPGGQ